MDSSSTGTDDPLASSGLKIPIGCFFTIASATLTCVLLFINGSVTLAFAQALARTGPPWAREPKLIQFAVFIVPVVLVVIQWMMIDYARNRIRGLLKR